MRERSALAEALDLVMMAVSFALMTWYLVPEHQRNLIAMRTARALSGLAAKMAEESGRAEMARELRGARPAYERGLFFSKVRDMSRSFYERLRTS